MMYFLGAQTKIIGALVILVILSGLAIKHLLYTQGYKDAQALTIAEAAERSIEAERRTGRARLSAEKVAAKGTAEVVALRRRLAKAATDAKAARLKIQTPGCPEPNICSQDLPLLQP